MLRYPRLLALAEQVSQQLCHDTDRCPRGQHRFASPSEKHGPLCPHSPPKLGSGISSCTQTSNRLTGFFIIFFSALFLLFV